MKRILALFLCIALFSPSTFAQRKKDRYGMDVLVGAKTGFNFNKIKGEEWLQTYNTNFLAGLYIAVNGERMGVQIEGMWSMNTVVSDTTFGGLYSQYFNAGKDSIATGKFTFHNFSIPVLLNYKLNEILWVQAGPQYTSRISELDKNDLMASGRTVFKQGELSAVAGLWVNVGKIGPIPKMNIGGRFVTSLNNINDLGNQAKWRNQRLQFHVGIGF